MKKDLILALLIGGLIGFAGTSFLWYNQKNKDQTPQSNAATSPTVIPPPSPIANQEDIILSLASPQNHEIFAKDKIKLEGNTNSQNIITISTSQESQFVLPNEKGDFSLDIELEGGLNQISITATTPQGQSKNKIIFVTYSTAKF